MAKHDLSQTEFGKRIGVSQSMVSQWLTGKRPMSARAAVQIEKKTRGEIMREDLLPEFFRRRNAILPKDEAVVS